MQTKGIAPTILDVYLAVIPDGEPISILLPSERARELEECTNETVKREKYFAWKLLSHAVKNTFGKDLPTLSPKKTENGKWTAEGIEFSLSHSDGVVCVALSLAPVGVDIQPIAPPKTDATALKILNESEKAEYATLAAEEKAEYFTKKWTQRESVFKSLNLPAFFPALPQLFTQKTATKVVIIDGKRYALSVASNQLDSLQIHENIDLTNE